MPFHLICMKIWGGPCTQTFCLKYSRMINVLYWWVECSVQTVVNMGPYIYFFTNTLKVFGGPVIGLSVSLVVLKVKRHCVIINYVYLLPVIRSGSSKLWEMLTKLSSKDPWLHHQWISQALTSPLLWTHSCLVVSALHDPVSMGETSLTLW